MNTQDKIKEVLRKHFEWDEECGWTKKDCVFDSGEDGDMLNVITDMSLLTGTIKTEFLKDFVSAMRGVQETYGEYGDLDFALKNFLSQQPTEDELI